MKKALFILLLLGFIALVVGTCNAQTKWASKEEAEEFFSLNYQNIDNHIYVPKYLKGHKTLSENERIIMFSDYVTVKMKVVGGVFWVIQEPKTRFVANENEKIVRLEICGNKISGFKKLDISETTSDKPIADCCDEILKSVDGVKQDTREIKGSVGELTAIMKMQLRNQKKEEVEINSSVSNWNTAKTISVVLATIGGAVAAGYIWQKETVTTIEPFGVQTGNGTIMWGPTETKVEKKFNPTVAVIGGLVSGGITYLLNKTIF